MNHNFCNRALTLKFQLLSIQFTSEVFESDRKMSAIEMFQQLGAIFRFVRGASKDWSRSRT